MKNFKTSSQAVTACAIYFSNQDIPAGTPSERRAMRQQAIEVAEREARYVETYKHCRIELVDPNYEYHAKELIPNNINYVWVEMGTYSHPGGSTVEETRKIIDDHMILGIRMA